MKLEDIFTEWDQDSVLDKNKLDVVSLGIPQMHSKYAKILSHERLLLRKYEADFKQLKLDKHLFYIDGPTQEQVDKGWELPAKGRILKSDVGPWLEADKDLISLSLKIGMQLEKVETLKSILDIISRTGFQLKNAIDFMKFMNGGF
jgi:hypothetical protein